MDFTLIIKEKLNRFTGITEDSSRVSEINVILNEVNDVGLNKLVQNFCSQEDSYRAYDILFEAWVCRALLQNSEIRNLEYEPNETNSPPDFRFIINSTQFDMQVKVLHNIHNEIIKRTFEHECKSQLSSISKPWFIHYGVSKDFERKHTNQFFQYIRKNLNHFNVLSSIDKVIAAHRYYWPDEKNKLVTFLFSEKTKKENNRISIGIVFDNVNGLELNWVEMEPIRDSVKRVLKKARTSLAQPIGFEQSNLVVMKADSELSIDKEDILNTLYGDESLLVSGNSERWIRSKNGLFRGDTFSTICGLLFVFDTKLSDKKLNGIYFPHPRHGKYIEAHPKPFPSLPFSFPANV